jgi:hypothetical protein
MSHLTGKMRTGANHTHLSIKNMKELGDLIQGVLAQNTPNPRDTGIVLDLENRPVCLVLRFQLESYLIGVRYHTPKFIESESFPVTTDTILTIENRTTILTPDE